MLTSNELSFYITKTRNCTQVFRLPNLLRKRKNSLTFSITKSSCSKLISKVRIDPHLPDKRTEKIGYRITKLAELNYCSSF